MDEKLVELWHVHPQAINWIEGIAKNKWSRAYDEDGRRWGHMMINLAKSINSVLKRVRFLLVLRLVNATFYKLNYYWVQCATTSHA